CRTPCRRSTRSLRGPTRPFRREALPIASPLLFDAPHNPLNGNPTAHCAVVSLTVTITAELRPRRGAIRLGEGVHAAVGQGLAIRRALIRSAKHGNFVRIRVRYTA